MKGWAVVCAVAVCAVGRVAARGDVEFGMGVGYSQVNLGGEAFDGASGVRIEPRVSFSLFEKLPQLRIGAGVGFSGYWNDLDDGDVVAIDGDVVVIDNDGVEGLTLITPEFQVAWRQPLGMRGDRGFYIEGGLGIGGVIGNYFLADDWGWDELESDWDAAFEVRPFVRGAYTWDGWSVGIEGSYMFGQRIEFNNRAEGDVSEWSVGAFFGYRF